MGNVRECKGNHPQIALCSSYFSNFQVGELFNFSYIIHTQYIYTYDYTHTYIYITSCNIIYIHIYLYIYTYLYIYDTLWFNMQHLQNGQAAPSCSQLSFVSGFRQLMQFEERLAPWSIDICYHLLHFPTTVVVISGIYLLIKMVPIC